MSTLDQPTAETILNPILSLIQQCIEDGWNEWNTFYAPKHHILDSRARASIVYCHIVDRAQVLFQKVPGAVPGRKGGIFRLFIGEEIALRFKKARKDGSTSNISTNQQTLIDLQLNIPGLLPGTMLNAVYQLDNLQRAIKKMMITHQLDRKVQWSISIAGDSPEPNQMLSPDNGELPKRRAQLKGKKETRKKASGEQ